MFSRLFTVIEQNQDVRRAIASIVHGIVMGAIGIALIAAGMWIGHRNGERDAQLAVLQTRHAVIVDTIHVLEKKRAVDAAATMTAAATRDTARAAFDSIKTIIETAADTATTKALPVSMVVPALHVCETAILADSIHAAALEQELADADAYGDAQRARADNDEAQIQLLSPPKIGFKTGLVAGAVAVLAATHPAAVVSVVKTLIHLF